MAYTDFTLASIDQALDVRAEPGELFPQLRPIAGPPWLADALARGLKQALLSEKARSEFIVAPILLAVQELSPRELAIYSGQRLDVDPQQGLVGECDFLLSASPPLPALQSPLLAVVEAKKNDIESGIVQCMAQMIGARLFNRQSGKGPEIVYGCVTNGEGWQFLRLNGTTVTIDRTRFYINDVERLLAAFQDVIRQSVS